MIDRRHMLAGMIAVALWAPGSVCAIPQAEDLLKLGHVRIDGSLDLSYDLGTLDYGSNVSFGFHLVHRLVVESNRQTRSELVVPELESYLVPADRGTMSWKQFGGPEFTFAVPRPIGGDGLQVGPGIWLFRRDDGGLTVRDGTGWRWDYTDGLLISAAGPGLIRLKFKTQGGLVTAVEGARMGAALPSMSARFDRFGRILGLAVGDRQNWFNYESEQTPLSRWTMRVGEQTQRVSFGYENGLLSTVSTAGASALTLRWSEVPHAHRSDCMWTFPVWVDQESGHRLEHVRSTAGYRLTATNAAGIRTGEILFNPRRGTITGLRENGQGFTARIGTNPRKPDYGQVVRFEEWPLGSR